MLVNLSLRGVSFRMKLLTSEPMVSRGPRRLEASQAAFKCLPISPCPFHTTICQPHFPVPAPAFLSLRVFSNHEVCFPAYLAAENTDSTLPTQPRSTNDQGTSILGIVSSPLHRIIWRPMFSHKNKHLPSFPSGDEAPVAHRSNHWTEPAFLAASPFLLYCPVHCQSLLHLLPG